MGYARPGAVFSPTLFYVLSDCSTKKSESWMSTNADNIYYYLRMDLDSTVQYSTVQYSTVQLMTNVCETLPSLYRHKGIEYKLNFSNNNIFTTWRCKSFIFKKYTI